MEKLTTMGMELATLLRREAATQEELKGIDKRIRELTREIQTSDIGTLYGPANEPVTERFSVPANVAMRRNADPVPMRTDRVDGGSTFALNPIMDTVTSGSLFAIVPCPNAEATAGPICQERGPHVHTADGAVHPTTLQDQV